MIVDFFANHEILNERGVPQKEVLIDIEEATLSLHSFSPKVKRDVTFRFI